MINSILWVCFPILIGSNMDYHQQATLSLTIQIHYHHQMNRQIQNLGYLVLHVLSLVATAVAHPRIILVPNLQSGLPEDAANWDLPHRILDSLAFNLGNWGLPQIVHVVACELGVEDCGEDNQIDCG